VLSDNVPGHPRRPRGARALLLAIAVLAVISAIGGTYLGLRGNHSHKSAADASASKPLPTTTSPAPATTSPAPAVTTPAPAVTTPAPAVTTPAPAVTTTTPAATTTTPTAPASTSPTTTPKRTLTDTSKPVAVPGGSFVVVSGKVSLTHVVVHGDTLFGIAQWYKLMGGVTALYDWNHSTVGSDPNLIFPGEVLTITVPGADIPKISPVWLAETTQAS
jgi:nucleoid-associated protein YgaU